MCISIDGLEGLREALNNLVDTVVSTSNVDLDERMHAVSEIRYYQSCLRDFMSYSEQDQKEFVLQLTVLVEEIGSWLKEMKE